MVLRLAYVDDMIDALEARTGYPPRAFTALRHQFTIDIDNGDQVST